MKVNGILTLFFALAFAAVSGAQERKTNGFSPEKFRADMQQFITKEACLTPQESAKFFPVYDEMNNKKRKIFDDMRRLSRHKPADEAGCRDVIRKCDKMDLELRKIQQTYHDKFLSIIPASKLFDVIRAEEKFHRRMLNKNRNTSVQERQGHGTHKGSVGNNRNTRK